MPKIKKYFLILLLIELLFSYAPAFAQTAVYDYSKSGVSDQIRQYLCAPTEVKTSQTITVGSGTGNNFQTTQLQSQAAAFNSNNGDLFKCINQMYKFAIVIAAVVGVFFIVIAGYVYISSEGNAESVEKAKSIVTSTIASLVILFGGYVFLKAINPDLITFNSIQPPSVVGGTALTPVSGAGGTGTGTTNNYVISGYNIGPYATDPAHETLVSRIYNDLSNVDFSSPASIDRYLKRAAPSTPLTGDMIFSSAQKYNVDAKLMVALMQQDSSLGTAGKGDARSHNPGNVGSTSEGSIYDSGSKTTTFPTWEAGVDAVAKWLSNHRA